MTVEKRIQGDLGSSILVLFLHVALINLIWVTASFLTALVCKFGGKASCVTCIFHQTITALKIRVFFTVFVALTSLVLRSFNLVLLLSLLEFGDWAKPASHKQQFHPLVNRILFVSEGDCELTITIDITEM